MGVTASQLSIARGGRVLLTGLDFHLGAGQILVLRGGNGSGKTSLLRVIAGLSPAAAGRLECDPDQILFAGHLDAIKEAMSVRENLAFWAQLYGEAPARLSHALAAFELTELETRLASHLSAGQRRRLGLARLAVSQRKIWALDEPTVTLDHAHLDLFERQLAMHLERGGSAILSTHLAFSNLPHQSLELSDFAANSATTADPFLDAAL